MHLWKNRHDRAVDHLNNVDKYRRRKQWIAGSLIVLVYIIVEILT